MFKKKLEYNTISSDKQRSFISIFPLLTQQVFYRSNIMHKKALLQLVIISKLVHNCMAQEISQLYNKIDKLIWLYVVQYRTQNFLMPTEQFKGNKLVQAIQTSIYKRLCRI